MGTNMLYHRFSRCWDYLQVFICIFGVMQSSRCIIGWYYSTSQLKSYTCNTLDKEELKMYVACVAMLCSRHCNRHQIFLCVV